jgi:hypothetical protein
LPPATDGKTTGRTFNPVDVSGGGTVGSHPLPRGWTMTLECPVCGETFKREEDLVRHQGEDHVGVDVPDEERAVP